MNTLPRSASAVLAAWILASFVSLGQLANAAPATLVSQNFDAVAPQTVEDGATLPIGADTGSLSLSTATDTSLQILATGPGSHVLRYTDDQNGGVTPNVFTPVFTGVSTTAAGNNCIVGSFDFTVLPVPTGSAPTFIFMINANGRTNVGPDSSVMITFSNNAGSATNVSYRNGDTTIANVTTLTPNTPYRLNLIADYRATGSANRDTYSFSLTDLATTTVVYRSPPITTRANADLVPNRMAFYGGAGNTVVNASPFFEIDNLAFTATDKVFHWGACGHPEFSGSPAYRSVVPLYGTSPVGQLDLIQELGCDYYRVGVGNQTNIDLLLPQADARNIKLLPILYSSGEIFDSARTVQEIYSSSYDKARAFALKYHGRFTHVELDNELDNDCIKGAGYAGAFATDYDEAKYQRVMNALKGLSDGIRAGSPTMLRIINTAGWYHYGFLDRLLADNVPFEVIGWHWYSDMGSMSRVMQKLSAYGKPIWVTELNRRGGSFQTKTIFSDNFDTDTLGAAPSAWTASGLWRVRQYGTVKAVLNEDQSSSTGRTLSRTFPELSGSWEFTLDYDWRWGGSTTHGTGNYALIIDCDVTDDLGNGYRLRIRQGNGNNPANDPSLLGLYKLVANTATLIPGAQGVGYNQNGFANGAPRLKRLWFRRDITDGKVIVDLDGNGPLAPAASGTDTAFDRFTRVTITTRGYGNTEQPLLDNLTLKSVYADPAAQAETLATLISEIRGFPGVEAAFVYELLDEPNQGTFNPESYYGLCSLSQNDAGALIFGARKLAFATYQAEILAHGTVPADPAAGIVIDDTYPAPATKYAANSSLWLPDSVLPGFYFDGYRHDAATNKSPANYVRFYGYIPVSGNYTVSIRYPANAGNSSAVPVTVHHNGLSPVVWVDQRSSGGTWRVLDTYYFNAWQPGHSAGNTAWETAANAAYVEINNGNTSGRVIIDAVRFQPAP